MIKEILKFSTPSCGQCKVVGKLLSDYGYEFTDVDCTDEVNEGMVKKYHITHVPMVLITWQDGSEKWLNNIQEVKQWLEHN